MADVVIGNDSDDQEKDPPEADGLGVGVGVDVDSGILVMSDDLSVLSVVVTTSVANFSTVTLSVSTGFAISTGVSVATADSRPMLGVLVSSSSVVKAAVVPLKVCVGSTGAILVLAVSNMSTTKCSSRERSNRCWKTTSDREFGAGWKLRLGEGWRSGIGELEAMNTFRVSI